MPLNWGASNLVIFTVVLVLMLMYGGKSEILNIVGDKELSLKSSEMVWCW